MRGALVSAIALLVLTPLDGRAAEPASDIEALEIGLPDGFRRPLIVVYPLIDQRRLSIDEQVGTSAAEIPPPKAWQMFLDTLGQAPNLFFPSFSSFCVGSQILAIFALTHRRLASFTLFQTRAVQLATVAVFTRATLFCVF